MTTEHALQCAHCGFECTHFESIEVFNRFKEDSPEGFHIRIKGLDSQTDRSMIGNPSSRRDGVCVFLSCEGCDGFSLVTLVQHKGSTMFDIKPIGLEG